MKNTILFVFASIIIPFKGFSQSINFNNSLPIDQSIKKGVLSNGLTYYIKKTNVVQDAASYYIIQNVGSILENDDQQGLAHFLEHMAFNGTMNFPGKGILNTLQQHGAVFGKDINAYTGFDETVYNLSNIPTKDGLLDVCLTVLKDWSNYLLLTDEEIDSERGVIKEEWRTRQNGQMRLFQTSLPITFNQSKYSERMPIGLMSVVEKFDYKALRDFYKDWYRTDLQAIAVIGDVNIEEVEEKIKTMFSLIPAVKNPKERFIVDIPEHEKMLYSLALDPEVSIENINFGIRHKKIIGTETVEDLKRSLLESMVSSMLSERIIELAQNPNASFLGANFGFGSLSRTTNALTLRIVPKPNQQKQAFSQVYNEVIRALKFGYVQPEIDRTITQLKSSYENQIAKKNDANHRQIARIIQNNYLENKTISDIEKQYEIAKLIFKTITKEELLETLKRLFTIHNRFLNVTGVKDQDNLTEEQAKKIMLAAENNNALEPYTEDIKGSNLISNITLNEGSIIKTIKNPNLESTTFTLSNGIKITYKFVDKEKDKVALKAISFGGTSLLNDQDLPSASLLVNLVQMSGLANFTNTDLKKILVGKTATVKIGLGQTYESFNGSSNKKDVETMLQLIHLYFSKPRFDDNAFKVLKSNMSSFITRRTNDVNEKMRDSLTNTLYGKNNPKERIFTEEYLSEITLDKIKSIYEKRFADASDFDFFIVGDVSEDQLKPLLEKYIASIATKNTKEKFIDNGAKWRSNFIKKEIFIPMEDAKARVNIAYKKEMSYSAKNAINTKVVGDILQLRITETIRESEGGAYSPRASSNFFREPKSQATISVSFDCNPDLVDRLSKIVQEEIKKIAEGNINDADLNKTKTNFLKERQQLKDQSEYDMQLLTNFFRYGENMNDSKNFENIINTISKKTIQNIAKKIIINGQSYEIIFKPKK
jgi:zinc protease